MNRRVFIRRVATFFLTSASLAHAQQAKKVPLIGYISGTDQVADFPRAEGIRLALRAIGYVEGQNITIEYRYAEGKLARYPELAAELVRLKVDVIVTAGGDSLVRPVMNATKTVPIVLTGAGSDPVKAGFVKSLAQPGGNVTGVTSLTTELGGKRLELFKQAFPKLVRVAVLYDPIASGNARAVKEELPAPARALGLTLRSWEVRNAEGLEKVFTALRKQRPDEIYVTAGAALTASNIKRTADFAIKSRLPSVYGDTAAIDAGGFMYYGADVADSNRLVAWYVDKILKGAKPADLPVQQPMKFEFVINKHTADQIGLTIPQWTLMQATKVIR